MLAPKILPLMETKNVKTNIRYYFTTEICSSELNIFYAEKTSYKIFEIVNVQIIFFAVK